MAEVLENHAKVKVEVASETKGDRLSLTALADRNAVHSGAAKPVESNTAVKSLPAVDFVISKGQQESVYTTDGDMANRKSTKKVDPSCSNSVGTADGSEVRFDRSGLCKNVGEVKWGKAKDGVMDITVGGKVNVQLDNNWNLVSVRSEGQSVHFQSKTGSETKQTEATAVPAEKRNVRKIDMQK